MHDDLDDPPTDLYAAANWLRGRHPWLDELATRACGPLADNPGWVDDITAAFGELARNERKWEAYERAHRAPDDETAYDAWVAAGPRLESDTGRAIAPMSSGEKRLLRLMTTLSAAGPRCESGWRLDDIAFDVRGDAVVRDWAAVVSGRAEA